LDIKIELNSHKAMVMWTLMYDLLYTKAGIIHTWPSYSILVASSLAAAASFLLFQFSTKDGHGRVDVAISYAYLVVLGFPPRDNITAGSARMPEMVDQVPLLWHWGIFR